MDRVPEQAPPGVAVSTPVSLRDLPATVLDLLHISRERIPGDSLARYWREQNLFSLETAIHKMTGLSARNFRLHQRGQLQPGWHADVVVLDPARVRDVATYQDPIAVSEGIEKVFVNGELAYVAGSADPAKVEVRARAGRLLKRGAA